MRNSGSALRLAIKLLDGQRGLARAIGPPIKQQHIFYWLHRRGGVVPAEVCGRIEAATGGKVTKAQLRPDLFRKP